MRLKSDFRDYYDLWFDGCGEVFERRSTSEKPRYALLQDLEAAGIPTPPHGTVCTIANRIEEHLGGTETTDGKVVVYLDDTAHCGEGKILVPFNEALLEYPNHYCTWFIDGRGESLRHLQIGDRAWTLKYVSFHDWRSNVGDGTVEVIEEVATRFENIRLPLFAVDFVSGYAVDLNSSPGMTCSGMEKILPGKEVVTLIESKIKSLKETCA